jgi:putative ABC transport system permease protein
MAIYANLLKQLRQSRGGDCPASAGDPAMDPDAGHQHPDDGRLARNHYACLYTMFRCSRLAIVLAAVGLYSVTAYSVAQRTQEIGIRMALGAEAQQVRWLILRRGIIQLAVGLALGLAGAMGVGRLLQGLLVGTGSTDAVTLVSISLVLVTVAMMACFWPARCATRLDPEGRLHE